MSVLVVDDLVKTYGTGQSTFQALKGINLTIEKGESVQL